MLLFFRRRRTEDSFLPFGFRNADNTLHLTYISCFSLSLLLQTLSSNIFLFSFCIQFFLYYFFFTIFSDTEIKGNERLKVSYKTLTKALPRLLMLFSEVDRLKRRSTTYKKDPNLIFIHLSYN
jgi:hypothetical protein